MPASTMRVSVSGSREAGPIVATILVRRISGSGSYCTGRFGSLPHGEGTVWTLTGSPSAVSRPPVRRSQIRSQCRADDVARRRSPDRSARARGGRCRPSSRRAASSRSARSMPAFVPIPSSPRKRAPASVASAASRYSWPPLRARAHDLAVSNVSATSATVTPRGLEGTVKRIVAVGRVLERAGEHLAAGHVAPSVGVDPGAAVDAQAQVGPVGLDPDLACRARAGRPARPGVAVSSRHACTGSGRSRNSARSTNAGVVVVAHAGLLGQRRRRPERAAPALASRASWIGARARPRARSAPGRRRPGSACSRARRSARSASTRSSLGQFERREVVELRVRREAVEVRGQRRRAPRRSERPRAALQQRAVQGGSAAARARAW